MTWLDRQMLAQWWSALGGPEQLPDRVLLDGARVLSSPYPVADLAAAAVATAGLALGEFAAGPGEDAEWQVVVDRALAGAWFGMTLRPAGWQLPAPWDPVSGDYRCSDGWIRLHTNDPVHRAAALSVLGVADSPGRASGPAVEQAVSPWLGAKLEAAVVAAGGCAAELRSPDDWRNHHQGMAVAHDQLVSRVFTDISAVPTAAGPADRPLAGLRVLDLTRVLAGPAATRFLAGFGAQVLRIDPPGREEVGLDIEMTVGKRCARMDLRVEREAVLDLLAGADVLIHGYRPGAMDRLGLDERTLHAARPGLVEVMLDAYGWSGPWRGRRGFDSLVQMSSGIAHPGEDGPGPTPLPVQALDHATGYLAAAAVLRGLSDRRRTGLGSVGRMSLARTGMFLQDHRGGQDEGPVERFDAEAAGGELEETFWGPGYRLPGPVTVGPARMAFSLPAAPFGSAPASWDQSWERG
jgi:crotonobetainyl-CoA:carnitine CoA-transferase CaiB-like acyl-CoA transferase